jgi:Tol biopolymer transport system component
MNNLPIFLVVLSFLTMWGSSQPGIQSPAEELPAHITRLTYFGQRADWSHDGKRILFIEKTFGDVYEIDLATGVIRPMTHHYFHEGYTRALYLSNGDILLSGAPSFDAKDPWPSRHTEAELWVLERGLSGPPTRLGVKCSEGPAVSRKRLRLAWTVDHGDEPERLPDGVSQFWMADISYQGGEPRLVDTRLILDSRDLDFQTSLETQNFRPPDEKELIFSAYGYEGTEAMGLDLENGLIRNYSKSPHYEEPEGISPDGLYTLVEADRHDPRGSQHIDIYRLQLDGSGSLERLTFFGEVPGFKASNPVVSDDGRFIAFQMAKLGDPAGVGRGLFIYDLEKHQKSALGR